MKKRLRSRILALALVGSSVFAAGVVLYGQEKPGAAQLLERGSKLYDQKQYEEAKKVLLDINPDQLPEDQRAKRDELLKQADLALAKTAPSNETFDNAKAAQEAGQLAQAAKLYESVIQNPNASTDVKQNARVQLELVHATQKQKAPAMKALLNDAVAAYEAGRLDEAQNALYTIESVGTETLDWQDASKPAKYERLIAEKRLAMKNPAPAGIAAAPQPTPVPAPLVAAPAPEPVVVAPVAPARPAEPVASTLVAAAPDGNVVATAPATETDLLGQTIDAQAIQKQRVQTLYDTYKSAVQDALAAGNYSKAVDQAREARAQVTANHALFSAQEYQALSADSDKLLADAQARAQKASEVKTAQDAKAAAEADQRLAHDRAKQRNAEINRLMDQAMAAADRQQYGEAINLIDNVLAIEPTNNSAKFLRRQMEDKQTFRAWQKLDATASREHALQNIENKELMIPYSQLVVYPEDWPELSRHRQADSAGNDSEANRRTRERLDAQIDSFSADKQGLKQVIDYLVQKTDVNIIANWKTLATVNVEEATPITLDLHSPLPLHKLLTTILDQASGGTVGYTVDEGAITITTKDDLNSAAQEPKISVYDIRDLLIQPDAQAQQPPTFNLASVSTDTTTQVTSTGGGGAGGGGGGGGLFQDSSQNQNQNNAQRRQQLVQDLITTVQFTVSPNSWDTTGGVGSLREHSGQLIVRQTVDNQIRVYNLLQQIREKRDLQIAIEARLLLVSNSFLDDFGLGWSLVMPAGSLGTNVGTVTVANNTANMATSPGSGVPGSLGGGNLTSNALEISGQILDNYQLSIFLRATQADKRATTVNAPRVTLFNGQSGYMFVANEQNFVENFSQTTATGAGNIATTATTLTIRTLPTGMLLAVEAAISSDRRYVIMKLRPQLASLEALDTFVIGGTAPSTTGSITSVGGPFVQLPRTSFTEVNTMVSVPDGGTLLIGGQKIVGEAEIDVGVPVLSKIPGLNRLFTNRSYTKDERTLLILVRPKIIIPHEEEYRTFGMNYDNAGLTGPAAANAAAPAAAATR